MYSLAAAPDFPSLRWGVDLFLSNFLGIETNFFKYMTYICIHSCEICILWGGVYLCSSGSPSLLSGISPAALCLWSDS